MALVEGQTGSGLPAYDVVSNVTSDDIVLASPLTQAGAGNVNFSNDNGGSTVRDAETTGPVCYTRATYQYNPIEWGAHGDGTSDDTVPLQNWLNATQPHMGVAGTFMVSSPLTCPADTTVQGPANLTGQNPLFTIAAEFGFSGTLPPSETTDSSNKIISVQGVIGALAFCRLSGVNVTGNGYYLPTIGTISNNSNCISSVGSTSGLHVGNYVVGANIPSQTTVTSTTACGTGAVQVSGPVLTCSPCAPENITFYGPDVVDVLANRVAIDGFSALSSGGNDLVCINTAAAGSGLQVKDTRIGEAMNDNIHAQSGCPNVRLIGDIIAHAGQGAGKGSAGTTGGVAQICGPDSSTCTGRGVQFSGDEMTISDGVVEESQGIGLDLDGTNSVSVNAMHFQANGEGQLGGAAIRISNAHTISVCGNHLEGNGGDVANSAQIRFGGVLDNINFCGNSYEPQSLADVTFRPSYVYDANPGTTTITNFHLYDAPAPQASGQVYSPNAAALLPQLQVPHVNLNQISGLVLSNNSMTATQVDVTPGEASDSASSVTVQLPSPGCNVNLAATTKGIGGLDTGSVAANTTYFYFLVATASGGNPACIASANMVPSFINTGTTYTLATTGNTRFGLNFLYNMGSIAGLAPGQLVQSNSYVQTNTTIVSVGSLTTQAAGSIAGDGVTVTVPNTTNVGPGMAVSDVYQFSGCSGTAASAIPKNDTVASVINGTTFTLSQPGTPNTSADCIAVSAGYAVQLSNPTIGGNANGAGFTIYNGVYRMVGALYTDTNSNVVGFAEDGDTFYLAKSVTDIETGVPGSICASTVGPSAISCPLSVPCGRTAATCPTPSSPTPVLKVEAFGRIVGGTAGDVLLSSLDQTVQPPMPFPNTPGYTTNSSTTSTSFPFRLYTDPNGKVRVQGSGGSSNAVYEVTDGWVLQR